MWVSWFRRFVTTVCRRMAGMGPVLASTSPRSATDEPPDMHLEALVRPSLPGTPPTPASCQEVRHCLVWRNRRSEVNLSSRRQREKSRRRGAASLFRHRLPVPAASTGSGPSTRSGPRHLRRRLAHPLDDAGPAGVARARRPRPHAAAPGLLESGSDLAGSVRIGSFSGSGRKPGHIERHHPTARSPSRQAQADGADRRARAISTIQQARDLVLAKTRLPQDRRALPASFRHSPGHA